MSRQVILLLMLALLAAWAGFAAALEVGEKAPEFPQALPSTAGESPGAVALQPADFLGEKNVVLAFYVADWTGG